MGKVKKMEEKTEEKFEVVSFKISDLEDYLKFMSEVLVEDTRFIPLRNKLVNLAVSSSQNGNNEES